jgi:hypothetical protein
VTQKRRTNAAYLEEEEDKEEDKTGVSIALFLLLSDFCISRRLLFHLSYKISFRSACEERSYSHHFVSLFDGSNLIKNPSHGGSEEEQRERFADVFVSGASRWEIFFLLSSLCLTVRI